MVVAQFEFLVPSSPLDGVILSEAVLKAKRRISRQDAVCDRGSLGSSAERVERLFNTDL